MLQEVWQWVKDRIKQSKSRSWGYFPWLSRLVKFAIYHSLILIVLFNAVGFYFGVMLGSPYPNDLYKWAISNALTTGVALLVYEIMGLICLWLVVNAAWGLYTIIRGWFLRRRGEW